MNSNIRIKHILIAALLLIGGLMTVVAAANYTYTCPKCHAVYTYSAPLIDARCPQDGTMMMRKF